MLFTQGYRFDFFQAVRLLEWLSPTRRPVGQHASPGDEVVRFRAHLALSFPPSAIHTVTPAAEGPAQMTVTFMGLTGPQGVLPRHYTELLLARVHQRDQTLRDFLDLFNHRMIAFFYRAWEKYHFPVGYERDTLRLQGEDRFSSHLFALIGLGTPGLRQRLEVQDAALLGYTGLLAQRPRSASALAGLLHEYFGVPVEVIQCVGQWLPLAEETRTRLGPTDEVNNALGVNAVAGDHVWDPQANFRLRLGPLTLAEFQQFLPAGSAFRPLVQLSRFFAGQECDFDVQLVLNRAEAPCCRLGEPGAEAPRLGWSAWLTPGESMCHAADAVFRGDLARPEDVSDWGHWPREGNPHAR
jgi:type VI secretion system protein ImpH